MTSVLGLSWAKDMRIVASVSVKKIKVNVLKKRLIRDSRKPIRLRWSTAVSNWQKAQRRRPRERFDGPSGKITCLIYSRADGS